MSSSALVTGDTLTDEQVRTALLDYVIREFFGGHKTDSVIEHGPLQTNYFSICFWVNVRDHMGQRGIYVKIPKMILFRENHHIFPLTDEDKNLAEDEYSSLVHLSSHWPNDQTDVHFVKPLGFLRDFNAILTERFYAKHFFTMFRRVDLNRRGKKPDSVHAIMSRLGTALLNFHKTALRECKFDSEAIVRKMQDSCSQLQSLGLTPAFGKWINSRLDALRHLDAYTHQVNTLKGFDVRQVFINEDRTVFVLDPGKMKIDYKEIDLARFIATNRILYWGSPLFFLRLTPHASYEKSFIEGYRRGLHLENKILSLLVLKELLKHWRMAYLVLESKRWPRLVKVFLRKSYIEPFYKGQIKAELLTLGT